MKLVTFSYGRESYGSKTYIGALVSQKGRDCVLDLNRAQQSLPTDMVDFLKAGEAAMSLARSAVKEPDKYDLSPLEDVTLLAPIPRPGKIICVRHNYWGHTGNKDGKKPPEYPTFFIKNTDSVIGPNQSIVYPQKMTYPPFDINLDFEGELAVAIGKHARYVSEEDALDYVAGCTIFNDVTARGQDRQGKLFDTFGPMGPVLVTADEIPDPGNLELRLELNGVEMQNSNTNQMIFSIPYLISYLSERMELKPGDMISTGTPKGTGEMHDPHVYMAPGSVVKVRIQNIGELVNTVVAERV